MLTALASLVAGVAVIGSQVRSPVGPTEVDPDAPVARATPFDVPTQALAFVAFNQEGLTIYEATVDQACPTGAEDCLDIRPAKSRVISVPGVLSASSLDLDEHNRRLAVLTADDFGNDTVSVVFLPPVDPDPDDLAPVPGGHATPDPSLPHGGPSGGSASPATQSPDPSVPGDEPLDPTPRSPDPDTTTMPASVPPDGPTAEPTVEVPSPDTTNGPAAPSGPAGAEPSGSAEDDPSDGPGGSPAASDPEAAPVAIQAIAEDVHVVGAPPAWSADGQMLAFSAMPSDRSRGPDVYTWRIGDSKATRLTDDHGSYFASWSGDRVAISRAASVPVPEEDGGGERIVARTVVKDIATGVVRPVGIDGLWMPSIDPTGRSAVVWQGQLARSGRTHVASRGELYLVDWRAIDPFRETTTPDHDDGAALDPGASASPAEPGASRSPGRRGGGEGRRGPQRSASPEASPDVPPATTQTPDAGYEATRLEPQRDARIDPVREWRVSWSHDGSAVGFWVSDTPGAAWGQLTVYLLTAGRDVDRGAAILSPALARRAFTLGQDRVAWVAPLDGRPDGELRLRTWGARGYGVLRIRDIDVSSGLPAF